MPDHDNSWTDNKHRWAPKSATEAFAHQFHDDAFKLYQAANIPDDGSAANRTLDEIEIKLKQARKAVKTDADKRAFERRQAMA